MALSQVIMQEMSTRQYLLRTLRKLLPGLLFNVGGTLIIYSLLHTRFPPSSLIPLLVAMLFPALSNIVSLVRHRSLDIFGLMVLAGIVISIVAALPGGSQQLLLIRKSSVTGALGLAFLASLFFPKSLGYYFIKQLMTANDAKQRTGFDTLWQHSRFQQAIRAATIFWGLLLLLEFVVQVALVLTLPIIIVLAVSPLIIDTLRIGGLVVTVIGGRRVFKS